MEKSVRFVIGSTAVGGAEKQLALVIPKLIKKGWRVRFVTLSSVDGELAKVFLKNSINIIKPGAFKFSKGLIGSIYKFFSILSYLYKEFRRYPDATTVFMMSHSALFGMTACLLAQDRGRKILSIRNTNDRQYSLFPRLYEKFLYRIADAFAVNSHELADRLMKVNKISRNKVYIVNNAAEFSQLSPVDTQSVRENLLLNKRTKVLLTVARLVAFKGHDDLLETLNIAKEDLSTLTNDDWICLFAGDGPERKKLENKARQLKLDRHIKFLGTYGNVNELLATCDLFIFPSHKEGMPNAVIEAMYMGCEVIGTDILCMRELTQGLYKLVPVRSPDKLADAIVASIRSPNKEVGIKARELIKENFSIDNAVCKWERVMQKI
ncbi:MAG: glycosyltransferase [Holosporales bacterium]|jgi:glycosyltransferase involved in cell wall biosynthesis|nr:glycosyltransferase [Holosporales bacterium]